MFIVTTTCAKCGGTTAYICLMILITVLIAIIKQIYAVVPPHLAHVVVTMNRGRKIYMSKELVNDKGVVIKHSSSYIYIPFLMQRSIMPLENIKLEIRNISLRDKDIAKFRCDVVCWVTIADPILAAERLGKLWHERAGHKIPDGVAISSTYPQIEADVKALIESVSRATAMEHDVIELMRDRHKLSETVRREIDILLANQWGLDLVGMEFLKFHDAIDEEFHVIHDLERKQAAVIDAEARTVVADQERDATIAESNAEKERELQIAENEELYRKRQIKKDQEVGISEQKKELAVQKQMQLANEQKIEAEKTITVGQAEYEADAVIKSAEGDKQSKILEADGEAAYTRETMKAKAAGEKALLLAEADGKNKLAEALKKYEDAAMGITILDVAKEVLVKQAFYQSEALKVAKLSVISAGEGGGRMFGLSSGEIGAGIATIIGSLKNSLEAAGVDTSSVFTAKEDKETSVE